MKIEKGKYRVYSVRRSSKIAIRIVSAILALLLCVVIFLVFVSICNKKPDNVASSSMFIVETSSVSVMTEKEESSAIASFEMEISSQASSKPTPSPSSNKNTSATVNTTAPATNSSLVYNIDSYAKEWTYVVDKSKPVPLQPRVDNSFFSSAMFVGDSITTGIDLYGIVKGAPVVAYTGINTNTILTRQVIKTSQGKITFLQQMKKYKPKHIFIMLGINGIAFQSKTNLISGYSKFVDEVKKQHPGAIIYLQSILPVTAKKQRNDNRFANSKINSYNAAIANLAKEKGVYYLNVAEAFKDGNGNLPAAASSDGIHFGPAYYRRWIEYLKTHTIYTGKIPPPTASSAPALNASSTIQTSSIPVTRPTEPPKINSSLNVSSSVSSSASSNISEIN